MSPSDATKEEFLRGAEALGLHTERKPLLPQQYVLSDVLCSVKEDGRPSYKTFAGHIPRRGTKSTTLLALAVGRCLSREDYQVAYTAQSGIKARERFLRDLVVPLERKFGEDPEEFKINRSRGGEHIRFSNGSLLSILPPIPDSFRGDSWDLVILDEAQAHAPDLTEELIGAIRPTMLTRPDAQMVWAGTVGAHRSGGLWDALENGRAGKVGIVEYAAPEDTPVFLNEEGEERTGTTADPEVWKAAHPGVGCGFIPVEAVEDDWLALPRQTFMAEYLGIWPTSSGQRFIDAGLWQTAKSTQPFSIPKQFSLAFSVHYEGICASIAIAWRDDKGVAHTGLVKAGPGTDWLVPELTRISQKYRVPVVYDKRASYTAIEVDKLKAQRPMPRVVPRDWPAVSDGAALFMRELESKKLRHYDQPSLNSATDKATKRGTANSPRWSFGRKEALDDITPLEAASMALHYWDETAGKPRTTFFTVG